MIIQLQTMTLIMTANGRLSGVLQIWRKLLESGPSQYILLNLGRRPLVCIGYLTTFNEYLVFLCPAQDEFEISLFDKLTPIRVLVLLCWSGMVANPNAVLLSPNDMLNVAI